MEDEIMKNRIRVMLAAGLLLLATVLLAGCGEKKTFTVTFDLKGGERVGGGAVVQKVQKGKDAEEPVAEREGYVFDGWDREYTNVQYNATLHAIWTEIICATFDTDGGTIVSGKEKVYFPAGEVPGEPKVEKEGFAFIGWEPELKETKNNTTYKAQWKSLIPTMEEVAGNYADSIVEIYVYDKEHKVFHIGLGCYIDTEGTVLTSYELVEAAYSMDVFTSGGRKYEAVRIDGYDKGAGLCILGTVATNTKPVSFAKEAVKEGDKLYILDGYAKLEMYGEGQVTTVEASDDTILGFTFDKETPNVLTGGPITDIYGNVVGIFSWFNEAGVNVAVSSQGIDRVSRSKPISVEKFGDLTDDDYVPPYTLVHTGDEAEELYQIATFIESEPNDTMEDADQLFFGEITGGYIKKEEKDIYCFYGEAGKRYTIEMLSYWHDDDPYLYALFRNSQGTMEKKDIGRSPILSMDDYRDDTFMSGSFKVPKDGIYYIYVVLSKDYPYKSGCYYVIDVCEES